MMPHTNMPGSDSPVRPRDEATAPPRLSRRAVLAAPLLRSSGAIPLRHLTVELDIGQTARLKLASGDPAELTVLAVEERRDPIRGAMREPRVRVRVNGAEAWLVSGNYALPSAVGGVQIDCPALRGFDQNAALKLWRLNKDVRLRLWPAGSPWLEPGTFALPLRRRWLSTDTQTTNEPVYVNGGDSPASRTIYYHNDVDLGGAEGLEEVYAAAAGIVVSARNQAAPGFEDSPARPRPDVIYIRDERGWFYRYSHFQRIDPEIRPGVTVAIGQRLGWLGKEGGAGWSHLHFGIQARQPSGEWGTEDAWPFLWEAAVREQKPEVLAVARPHRLARAGDEVELDGARSWSSSGRIARYEWTLSNGRRAEGARVSTRYERPGSYSEILKVTDSRGRSAWDFCVVQVLPAQPPASGENLSPGMFPPAIHALCCPSAGIRPKQNVRFLVCTFRTRQAEETWDFGDGSPPVTVRSKTAPDSLLAAGEYAETSHSYARPGDYIVRVTSRNERGETAAAHLWVPVRA